MVRPKRSVNTRCRLVPSKLIAHVRPGAHGTLVQKSAHCSRIRSLRELAQRPEVGREQHSQRQGAAQMQQIRLVSRQVLVHLSRWWAATAHYFSAGVGGQPSMCVVCRTMGGVTQVHPTIRLCCHHKDEEGRQWWHRANRHPSGDGVLHVYPQLELRQCFTTDGQRSTLASATSIQPILVSSFSSNLTRARRPMRKAPLH